MPASRMRIETGSRFLRMLGRMVLFACVFGLQAWHANAADDAATLEHRIKAAYLYQFAGYVEWPPDSFAQPDTPVTIAVLGAESLAAELNQVVTGRTVGGRTVVVKRVKAGEPLAGVHILFIGRAERARLVPLAQASQSRAILTVTESDGALAQGSMINFVLVDRRVRFEVALDPVEKSGLKLSSRLLAVAQQVRTEAP
ncbi:MAG TPA: YfiR family protein [Burkholderiales bacterium]|nr:YfiR family protein [Burkholderiales bacterium]